MIVEVNGVAMKFLFRIETAVGMAALACAIAVFVAAILDAPE
ncbi:MAG: hypothetical protein ABI330_02880 [Caldimonas sp.]